ncbi:hypothetical protein WMY93_034089 [Mugilogobius chulae]|uniref:Uncharacterized protein n=1 Tax=Mugilogobius chulae TaxID=88201 RepID=A0AAW0MIA2_9GOBI
MTNLEPGTSTKAVIVNSGSSDKDSKKILTKTVPENVDLTLKYRDKKQDEKAELREQPINNSIDQVFEEKTQNEAKTEDSQTENEPEKSKVRETKAKISSDKQKETKTVSESAENTRKDPNPATLTTKTEQSLTEIQSGILAKTSPNIAQINQDLKSQGHILKPNEEMEVSLKQTDKNEAKNSENLSKFEPRTSDFELLPSKLPNFDQTTELQTIPEPQEEILTLDGDETKTQNKTETEDSRTENETISAEKSKVRGTKASEFKTVSESAENTRNDQNPATLTTKTEQSLTEIQSGILAKTPEVKLDKDVTLEPKRPQINQDSTSQENTLKLKEEMEDPLKQTDKNKAKNSENLSKFEPRTSDFELRPSKLPNFGQNAEFPESQEEILTLDDDAFCPQDLEESVQIQIQPNSEADLEDLTEANVRVKPLERYVLKESPSFGSDAFSDLDEPAVSFADEDNDVPIGFSSSGSLQIFGEERIIVEKEKEAGFGGLYRTREKFGEEADVLDKEKKKKTKADILDEKEKQKYRSKYLKNWIYESAAERSDAEGSEREKRGLESETKGEVLEEMEAEREKVCGSEGSLDKLEIPFGSEWQVYGRSSGRMSKSPPKAKRKAPSRCKRVSLRTVKSGTKQGSVSLKTEKSSNKPAVDDVPSPKSVNPVQSLSVSSTNPLEKTRISGLYGGKTSSGDAADESQRFYKQRETSPGGLGRFGKAGSGDRLMYGQSRDRMSRSASEDVSGPKTLSPSSPIDIEQFGSRNQGPTSPTRSRALSPTSPTEFGRFGKAGSGDRLMYRQSRDRMSRSLSDDVFGPRALSPTSPTELGRFGKPGSGEWLVYGQSTDRISRAERDDFARSLSPNTRALSPDSGVLFGRFSPDVPQTHYRPFSPHSRPFSPQSRSFSPDAQSGSFSPPQRDSGSFSPEVHSGSFSPHSRPFSPEAQSGSFTLQQRDSGSFSPDAQSGSFSPPQSRSLGRFGKADSGEWKVYGNSSSSGRMSLSPEATSPIMSPTAERSLSPDSSGDWMVYRSLSPRRVDAEADLSPLSSSPLNTGHFRKTDSWNAGHSDNQNSSSKDEEKLRKRTLSPPHVQNKRFFTRSSDKSKGGVVSDNKGRSHAGGRSLVSSIGKFVNSEWKLGRSKNKASKETGSSGGRVISSSDGPIRSSGGSSSSGAKKERISVCKMSALSMSRDQKKTGEPPHYTPQTPPLPPTHTHTYLHPPPPTSTTTLVFVTCQRCPCPEEDR